MVDPELSRWGLDQLEVCTLTNAGSSSSVTRYENDSSQSEYIREYYCQPTHDYVENDAVIAQVLQEELSDAAKVEYMQEWYKPSKDRQNFDSDGYRRQADGVGSNQREAVGYGQNRREAGGSSDSGVQAHSYGENGMQAHGYCENEMQANGNGENGLQGHGYCIGENGMQGHGYCENEIQAHGYGENGIQANGDGENGIQANASEKHTFEVDNSRFEEDLQQHLNITDDSETDDIDVGKRLNQMVPVPHVPKINGELPSADEEMSDHERLLERLKVYGLVENTVQGDGNCQFRALADQLYRTSDEHKFVREQVVNQLKLYQKIYDGYVPMAYNEYLKRMSKNGEWGDHVTLQAASDWFGVRIFMITSFKDTCYIEILPNIQKSKRVIHLSFWAEVHYNSIYPEDDLPILEGKGKKKKKSWWLS